MKLLDGYEMKHGFVKQTDPEPFNYSTEYKLSQSTNKNMSYLRLGLLMSCFDYDQIADFKICDVGSGNMRFVNVLRQFVPKTVGYDVGPGSEITKADLLSVCWDLVVLTDVLEHFDDIDELWKIRWKYMLLSYPEMPEVDNMVELLDWHHFKPDEHIWYFGANAMYAWLHEHDCRVLIESDIEDIIRRRQNITTRNITTMIIRRGQ